MRQFELILASSSQTRKDLMDRLHLNYRCISPDIDESTDGELHAHTSSFHIVKYDSHWEAKGCTETCQGGFRRGEGGHKHK